jgi:hypothetical protein
MIGKTIYHYRILSPLGAAEWVKSISPKTCGLVAS